MYIKTLIFQIKSDFVPRIELIFFKVMKFNEENLECFSLSVCAGKNKK